MKSLITLSIIAMMFVIAMSSVMAVTFESDCPDANHGNDLDGINGDNTKISESNSGTSVCVDGQSESSG